MGVIIILTVQKGKLRPRVLNNKPKVTARKWRRLDTTAGALSHRPSCLLQPALPDGPSPKKVKPYLKSKTNQRGVTKLTP